MSRKVEISLIGFSPVLLVEMRIDGLEKSSFLNDSDRFFVSDLAMTLSWRLDRGREKNLSFR